MLIWNQSNWISQHLQDIVHSQIAEPFLDWTASMYHYWERTVIQWNWCDRIDLYPLEQRSVKREEDETTWHGMAFNQLTFRKVLSSSIWWGAAMIEIQFFNGSIVDDDLPWQTNCGTLRDSVAQDYIQNKSQTQQSCESHKNLESDEKGGSFNGDPWYIFCGRSFGFLLHVSLQFYKFRT